MVSCSLWRIMCIEYRLHPGTGELFYVTDVVLPPILFGVGVVGNLLLLVVLNRRPLRTASAVYVYYAAAAAVDLVALFCAVPTFLRHADVVPLSVAYSRSMAYAVWACRAVEPMLRHTAGWMTTTAAAVRCAAVRLASSTAGTSARWTRISPSRIVALVVFVACVLLDFTRFLDSAVVELRAHCFPGVRLWSQNVTALGRRRFYVELQPAASIVAGDLLPLVLTLLFTLVLSVGHLRCFVRPKTSVARRTSSPVNLDEERDHQLSVTVFALSAAFIVLDGPTAALQLTRVFYFRSSGAAGSRDSGMVYDLSLVAGCLSTVRCAVNCVVMAVISGEFRKTVRRTFCCCCAASDDQYFDPVTCCSRAQHRAEYDDDDYRPKTLPWNYYRQPPVDMATTDVITAWDSPTRNGDRLYPLTILGADQQKDHSDSSLWV